MLQLLRINNPVIVLFSVFISLFLHGLAMLHPFDATFVLHYSEPLSEPLFTWLYKTSGTSFFYVLCVLGCVIQIVQAIFINSILNDFKIISKRSYLGGFIFILCSSFDQQWLILSPQQISTLLVMPIFYFVFTLSRQERFYTPLFDLGFFASLSALFYFPSIFFLILIFPALYSVRSFNFREFLRILVGISTPFFIVISIAYLNDNLDYLWKWVINQANQEYITLRYFNTENIILLTLSGSWLLIGAFLVSTGIPSLAMQARKMIGTVSIYALLIVIFFLVPTRLSDCYWLLLSISTSFFLSIVLSEMRNVLIANIIFALLFLSAIIPKILLQNLGLLNSFIVNL